MKRLFGKFQQLDGSDRRQRRGTGLGLAISKAIIEQHGGRIGVQSQVGVGSTFWFELPVPMARTPEPDRPQALVVVVDDDASFRSVLALRLRSMGIDCVEAADGAEAISEIRNHKPDLIILDVGLPRPDGFEVVDILRRDGARQTPLLVYTGRDLTREDAKRLSLGRTRHLTKSRASEETFVEAVRGLLRGEKS